MRLIYCLICAIYTLSALADTDTSKTTPQETVAHPLPHNDFLADSPWPMVHRHPYGQTSVAISAPESKYEMNHAKFGETGPINLALVFSSPYSDGTQLAWGRDAISVYKATINTSYPEIIDRVALPVATTSQENPHRYLSHNFLLDHRGILFIAVDNQVLAYADHDLHKPYSDIALTGAFTLPQSAKNSDVNDTIVGLNMTYDGYLVIATENGLIGTLSRDFSQFFQLKLNDSGRISNTIAVDENGGVYVITSKKLHRLQWLGDRWSAHPKDGAWSIPYKTDQSLYKSTQIAPGARTAPVLMGTGQEDKLIAIIDGQYPPNLLLLWRENIPDHWRPIATNTDRRIAAQVPLRDHNLQQKALLSLTQSILVSGYDILATQRDDTLTNVTTKFKFDPLNHHDSKQLAESVERNFSDVPQPLQRFRWDPVSKQLTSIWITNTTSACIYNAPTLSTESNLLYCAGRRNRIWTLEAIDWSTGEPTFFKPMGLLPRYYSFQSATQIGPNGSILMGSLSGLLEMRAK